MQKSLIHQTNFERVSRKHGKNYNLQWEHPTKETDWSSILILTLVLSNVEVPKFINTLIFVGSNHTEPIAYIMFLKVFLCQILQIPEQHNPNKNTLIIANIHNHTTEPTESKLDHPWRMLKKSKNKLMHCKEYNANNVLDHLDLQLRANTVVISGFLETIITINKN